MMIQYGLFFLILLNLVILFFLIFLFKRIHQIRKQNIELNETIQKQLKEHDACLSDADIIPLITDEQLSTLLRATIKRAIELHPKQKQEAASEESSTKKSSTEPKEENPLEEDTP